MFRILFLAFIFTFIRFGTIYSCSILYFIDKNTGKIYVANLEDYWYDAKTYLEIIPRSKNQLARLWYGWDDFAQGGINEAGLFFDGAVTPDQKMPEGYHKPQGNLGDKILSVCKTVQEATDFLEQEKTALSNGHMMFGDAKGNAVVVEWVSGVKKTVPIQNNHLLMTNFLLSDPSLGNYPCYRYEAIEKSIQDLEQKETPIDLREVGNTLGKAAQPPQKDKEGKVGGTLYSTFINITEMEFVLVYKLDNSKVTKLDLKSTFAESKKKKIKLE